MKLDPSPIKMGASSCYIDSKAADSLATSAALKANNSSADSGCLLVLLESDGGKISEKRSDIHRPVGV